MIRLWTTSSTPGYEAEDHLQASAFVKSVSKASFDIAQGSAEEFEKSVDSFGAFECLLAMLQKSQFFRINSLGVKLVLRGVTPMWILPA